MPIINLKYLQQNRNTIFLIGGMIVLAIFFAGIFFGSKPLTSKQTTLEPSTTQINPSASPDPIDWSKMKLGMSESDVIKVMGEPKSSKNNKDGTKTLSFLYPEDIPLPKHIVIISEGKAVSISRHIDSNNHIVSAAQYRDKLQEAQLLQPQLGDGVYAKYGFQEKDNEYVVLEIDMPTQQIYNITKATTEEYQKIQAQAQHQDKSDEGFGI